MNQKCILAIVICIAVIATSLLYFNLPKDTEQIDLKTFDYAAVTKTKDFPDVNVTGVIDNICLLPNLPLWDKAGGGEVGGKISITVKGCPGTSMFVADVQQYENTTWYRVRKYEERDGLHMNWDGWTTEKAILQGPLPVKV